MRKITINFILLFSCFIMQSQIVVLQENFTTYLGTAITAPAGWYFSNNSNYTTVASSGTSGPNSYRFGVTNATVITPQFAAGADSLKFWTKLNGSGVQANDTMSVFYIYQSLDSTNFTAVDSIRPISQAGKSRAYKLLATTKWIKFIYKKIGGNLAFDDVKIIKNPPVTANFTFTNVCLGTCMPFTNTSSSTAGPVVGWFWDFDNDGNVDDVTQNPCYLYLTAGTHTVTMVAVDAFSNFDTITKTVSVYANPTAVITALSGQSGCVGDSLCFNDGSTGGTPPYVYLWDVENGMNYTTANICHTYTVAGISNTDLLITDVNGCKDSTSLPMQINPLPLSNFTTNNVCFGTAACFTAPTDPNICTVFWDFGDGSVSTTLNPCSTYTLVGTYTVCLTTISCLGCSSYTCMPLTVTPIPVASFTYTSVGLNYSFIDQSIPTGSFAAWSWDFGDPSTGVNNTSSIQNPSHTFSANGFYSVLLLLTDTNGCTSGTQLAINANAIGIPTINSNSAMIISVQQNTLYISNNTVIGQLEIYNSLGSIIHSEIINDNQKIIATDQLAGGIYFVRIRNKNENVMKKITITH